MTAYDESVQHSEHTVGLAVQQQSNAWVAATKSLSPPAEHRMHMNTHMHGLLTQAESRSLHLRTPRGLVFSFLSQEHTFSFCSQKAGGPSRAAQTAADKAKLMEVMRFQYRDHAVQTLQHVMDLQVRLCV